MRLPTRCCLAAALALFAPASGFGQRAPHGVAQADRVSDVPPAGARLVLPGHVPGWARPSSDAGPVAPATALRLTFVLTRSADRQAAFEQMLVDQQNPSSPQYHQWLTPQEVGDLYGPTPHDLAAVTTWLSGNGFTVRETAPSGVFVTVDATAGTAAAGLQTEFRLFHARGTAHVAAIREPSIPSALAPLIGSIDGLSDSLLEPMHEMHRVQLSPSYTSSTGAHYLTPQDFATIFDIRPVYTAGYTGTGQRAAVVGRSRIVSSDVTDYEANTGLPMNLPNVIVPPNGVDPGVTQTADEGEALLDVDRILGVAPGAQVDLIVSNTSSGGRVDCRGI